MVLFAIGTVLLAFFAGGLVYPVKIRSLDVAALLVALGLLWYLSLNRLMGRRTRARYLRMQAETLADQWPSTALGICALVYLAGHLLNFLNDIFGALQILIWDLTFYWPVT